MYEVFEKLLKLHGLTIMDVVRSTGINQSTLSNWKRRRNKLSAKNAEIIAAFFNISVDYLMTGTDYYNRSADTDTDELLDQQAMRVLIDAAKGCSPEDLNLVASLLKRLKACGDL